MNLTDWIGTSGVAILLVAFLLNLLGKISQQSRAYLFMNTIGAALACMASVMLRYWPFIILEGCWTIVSLVGLIRSLIKK